MIQRIQSLWLLLAAVCSFLTMKFPFFVGANAQINFGAFSATTKIFLLILTSILGTLCLFTIFLFKQRKMQLWLTILAIVLSICNLLLYFNYKEDYPSSNLALASIFAFIIPVFLFFAVQGIYRDQKLVKSMDRLR